MGSDAAGCGCGKPMRSAPLPLALGAVREGPSAWARQGVQNSSFPGEAEKPCGAWSQRTCSILWVLWAGAWMARWPGEAGLSVARVPALLTGLDVACGEGLRPEEGGKALQSPLFT